MKLNWPKYMYEDTEIKAQFLTKENQAVLQEYEQNVNAIQLDLQENILLVKGPIYIKEEFIDQTIILLNNSATSIVDVQLETELTLRTGERLEGKFLLQAEKYGEILPDEGMLEFCRFPNNSKLAKMTLKSTEYEVKSELTYTNLTTEDEEE
ncbi:hypothetical protein HB957_13330 [Listeria welshimeri]|nr:hypothetical protein [Listeria welshimeri]